MSFAAAASRFEGYRRRAIHEIELWRHSRARRADAKRFESWLAFLHRSAPQVLIGANFPDGGVGGHVKAIQRYSGLRTALVPDDRIIGGLDRFSADTRARFMAFDPPWRPVLHSHVLPWMIRWCRRRQENGLPWVHTYHNMYFPEFARDGLLPWQAEINDALVNDARHADARISVSRWQQQYLKEHHEIATEYIPNGVDVVACDRGDADRFARRVGTAPFILFVGRNDPVKNPVEVLRAAHSMPRQRFVLIGADLNKRALELEWQVAVPENVEFFDNMAHHAIQDALAACSALVVTSKREGLPTIVLEALAHGKPTVVPDEAGCVEAVAGGRHGMVYQPGDVPDLVAKLRLALDQTRPVPGARERILDEYDWRIVAPAIDAVYRRLYE